MITVSGISSSGNRAALAGIAMERLSLATIPWSTQERSSTAVKIGKQLRFGPHAPPLGRRGCAIRIAGGEQHRELVRGESFGDLVNG